MWGKKKSNPKAAAATTRFDTLISNKTKITGDIHFSGGLHIDGKVAGTIRAEDDGDAVVRISNLAIVEGDVVAPHVIVNGRVNGDVYSTKHIELAAKASIKGNVYYNLIEMAMGAAVNGSLVHSNKEQQEAAPQAALPKAAKPELISSKTGEGKEKGEGALELDVEGGDAEGAAGDLPEDG